MCTTVDDRTNSAAPPSSENQGTRDVVFRRACHVLEANPYFRGRVNQLDISTQGDRLVVKGRVPSFFLKQVLQSLLMQVEGVHQVENCVDVTPPQGLT